jgi:hypothetical protein
LLVFLIYFGDETDSNQPKILGKKSKISRKNPQTKSLKAFAKCFEFQKENRTLEYGFKNLYKIYSLADGFLFFVISISRKTTAKQAWASSVVFSLGEFFWSFMVYLSPADSF